MEADSKFSALRDAPDFLCTDPGKLLICDILKLKPFPFSKNLFLYNSHLVKNIEVLGVVTSIKHKEDTVLCAVDDGTGSMQCYCDIPRSSLAQRPGQSCSEKAGNIDIFNSAPEDLLKPFEGGLQRSIVLGDFVVVHGFVKRGLWNDSIYLSNGTWAVKDSRGLDDVWEKRLQHQMKLYKEVYDKPLKLDEHQRTLAKTFAVDLASRELKKDLEVKLKDLIQTSLIAPHEFFGYELMEVQEIQASIDFCFKEKSSEGKERDWYQVNKAEKKSLIYQALASLLHRYVASGHLIRKKCLEHEAVVKMDQLDSRYYITIRCKQFLNAVRDAIAYVRRRKLSVDPHFVMQAFDEPSFNFIKKSKYGMTVLTVAMEHLSICS
ncbi:CST complex subunit STN1-like [Clavelina lepadiformis]|uniref:CST complex subunit STN1-like n=1 Tax=Clavelina lepadiformis TaxID=159417 RepID=UPI00404121D7